MSATATSGLAVTSHDRRGKRGCLLDRGLDGVVHRRRHLRDQRQPGRQRELPAPRAGAAVVRGGASDADDQLHLDRAAAATVGGPTYTVTATATSGLPVTFTTRARRAPVCSIAGSTVSFIGVGTCVIDANQAGNANYNAAPQVQQSFAVGKGAQTISFTFDGAGATVGGRGATYSVTATATSGLTVAFTADATSAAVCSIAGSTVSFIGAGTCMIDANQAGNANYNAAPQVQQSFAVGKGAQTISFTSTAPAAAIVGGRDLHA